MDSATTGYPIRVAARRSGLSTHVIRAWEKRYGAIRPTRTPGNQRSYTESDISKLLLIKKLLHLGHSIGRIAPLKADRLAELLRSEKALVEVPQPPQQACLEACWQATETLDPESLERHLQRGLLDLGQSGLIDQVVVPLLGRIGQCWEQQQMGVAHEHLASCAIRTFLGRLMAEAGSGEAAPVALVATPAGQQHEIGALLFAIAAANVGWRVLYLGPDLPASELIGAALESGAGMLALSVIQPQMGELRAQLAELRRALPQTVSIVLGGREAASLASPGMPGVIIYRSEEGFAGLLRLARQIQGREKP